MRCSAEIDYWDGPKSVKIEKDSVEIELDQNEWKELQATMNGKRESYIIDEDGYVFKTMYVFNKIL